MTEGDPINPKVLAAVIRSGPGVVGVSPDSNSLTKTFGSLSILRSLGGKISATKQIGPISPRERFRGIIQGCSFALDSTDGICTM
jgi:hypothetical protein